MSDALFYGSGTALVTPFIGNEVDYSAWKKLIEFQLSMNTDALIVLGTTGESPTVTFNERKKLCAIAIDMAKKKLPVIISVGSNCTKMAAELAVNARESGADGILLSAPSYNRPSSEGILNHFNIVADSAQLPVIAYNVPQRTGVNISPALMCELARHPLIRGLKEASTDAAHISRMMLSVSDGIAVYSGNDSQTISIMAQGGRGVISVTSNILPREISAFTHAILRDDYDTARRIYYGISDIVEALSLETNPAPVKYAMSILGMCEPTLRLPMFEVSAETKKKINKVISPIQNKR